MQTDDISRRDIFKNFIELENFQRFRRLLRTELIMGCFYSRPIPSARRIQRSVDQVISDACMGIIYYLQDEQVQRDLFNSSLEGIKSYSLPVGDELKAILERNSERVEQQLNSILEPKGFRALPHYDSASRTWRILLYWT